MSDGTNLMARNALEHRYAGLLHRDEPVIFEGMSIYLRLEVCCLMPISEFRLMFFSGRAITFGLVRYVALTCSDQTSNRVSIQIKTTSWSRLRKPITNAKLAGEIAKSLNLFIEVRPSILFHT